ncbi:MAG: HAD family phosphatase [Sulfurimonas sp.]|nr:HAD family phosphatase [Sulfurimonas sp.]
MKKYILFDNDGVLVETEMYYFKSNKKALKEFFSLELEFDVYMEIMARGGKAWEIAEIRGFSQKEIVKARIQRDIYYQKYIKNEDIAINGVQDILKELSKKYKMGIITTSKRDDFELIHNGRGIVDFMEFTLCVEDYKRSKPHPEPYLSGLKKFNANKEEAIVVEDSQRGLTSAYRAGIECVIVHNDFTSTHDFSKATYKIKKLSELEKLLNK